MAIKSIKFHLLLFPVFWLLFLFNSAYATVNSLSNVHFCLPNAQGQPPKDCTGLVLSEDTVAAFSSFYQNLPILDSNWTSSSRLVPYPSASTSQTPLNMVKNTTATTLDYNVYNPVVYQWKDISKVVYFGGSVNEGQVLLPTPGWIKAAHQNGSSIFATIFFSPTAYGGGEEETQLDYMLTPDSKSGHYPVADLLISVAKEYGIDGYFINQETPYPSGKSSQDLSNFVSYLQEASAAAGYPIKVEWYFVGGSNGANAFVSDSLFIDYGLWSSSTIDDQIAKGYPAANVEYGINGAYGGSVPDTIPNDASVAMFAFSNVLAPDDDRKTAPSQQYANAVKFWIGVPSELRHSNTLKYSQSDFFATNFNAGIGDDYYIQGEAKGYDFWSAMGLQDLLPVDLTGTIATLNFSDAYIGGSSLQVVSTEESAGQEITLYNNLNVVPTEAAVLAVKYKPISMNESFQVCAHYTDGDDQDSRCVSLTANNKIKGNTWAEASVNLPQLSNAGYYDAITLTLPKSGDNQVDIGQIFLGSFESYGKKPAQVRLLKSDLSVTDGSGTHYIVSWKNVSSNKYYNVYVNDKFYGATYQNIEDVMVTDTNSAKICVVPQNYGGMTGDSSCITLGSKK
jgi:hypothetical protein